MSCHRFAAAAAVILMVSSHAGHALGDAHDGTKPTAPTAPTQSGPARARALAKAGVTLARDGKRTNDLGKIDAAIAKFKAAYALDPQPEYHCSVAIAYRQRNRYAQAHAFMARCIARMARATAKRRDALHRVHADLESRLRASGSVPIDIHATPPGSLISVSAFASDELFPAPVQLWLAPGAHTITSSATGYATATRQVTIKPGERLTTVSIILTKAARNAPAPQPAATEPVKRKPAAPVGLVPPIRQTLTAPRTDRSRSKRSWLLVSAGGAAAIGGAVFHVLAYRSINDLAGLEGTSRSDKVSTIKVQRAAAIGLYVVGALTASYGTYRLLETKRRRTDVALVPPPRGRGMMLVWSHTR